MSFFNFYGWWFRDDLRGCFIFVGGIAVHQPFTFLRLLDDDLRAVLRANN